MGGEIISQRKTEEKIFFALVQSTDSGSPVTLKTEVENRLTEVLSNVFEARMC